MDGKHKKNKRFKKILINIVLLAFIGVFAYSTYQVVMWVKNNKETEELENKLIAEVVIGEIANTENANGEMQIDFKKLEEINSDVIGWIKINNTHINYPILQGETEQYYLRKDIYKKYSISGSIFIDDKAKSDFTDDNTVIYGHNMKNGSMFSSLTEIYNGNLGKDVEIEIYTKKGVNKYKVVTAYIGEPKIELIQKNFEGQGKKNYIDNAIAKSNYKFNTKVDYKKNMITLLTCDETSKNRVVVTAIKE